MDATGNFFIIIISIILYFFLIGLIYIKVTKPQYPVNWVLVMQFMLGLNNYDNFQIDNFDTMSNTNVVYGPNKPSIKEQYIKAIPAAGKSIYYKLSKKTTDMIEWISLRLKRLFVKLYIKDNTFYNTQRINHKPLVTLV